MLCCAGTVFAQKDTGAIVGTVIDVSGGSVPGAQVSALNTATNFAYHAVTNAAGQYVYTFNANTLTTPVTFTELSRWQLQIGAKIEF